MSNSLRPIVNACYLAPGDVIESEIEGLGGLLNRCVAAGA